MSIDPETKSKIWDLVREVLGVPSTKIHDRALLIEDLGADSLDFVELQICLRDHYDINLPETVMDDVMRGCRTVGDLVTVAKAIQTVSLAELRGINVSLKTALQI